jgi:hypothetical protein
MQAVYVRTVKRHNRLAADGTSAALQSCRAVGC